MTHLSDRPDESDSETNADLAVVDVVGAGPSS